MTALLAPLVIAPDVGIFAVEDLPPALRGQLGEVAPGERVVGRSRSRTRPILLSAEAAALLERFGQERTVAEAVIELASLRDRDPGSLLDEALPVLLRLYDARILVPAGDSDRVATETGGLPPGTRLGGLVIQRALQLFDDCEVYLASLGGEQVALKLGIAGDAQIREKLNRERQILECLGGTLAPALLDADLDAERPFLVLRWLNAESAQTLSRRLRQAGARPGPLLDLARRVAEAYAELHARGIAHGDVHPGNVLVESSGRVWLIDFGVARFHRDRPAGFIEPPREGIPYFFEPEYAAARLARTMPPAANPSGDQYGVAALIQSLLTGRHYLDFSLAYRELYRQIVEDPPISGGMIGQVAGVGEVLARALQKESAARFSSMEEMAAALRAIAPRPGPQPLAAEVKAPLKAALPGALARCAEPGPVLERALSRAPTASVMFGGAGTAYALWRAAMLKESAALLAAADLWISAAGRNSGESAYFRREWDISSDTVSPISLHHGRPGVELVRALIAHARWDLPALRAALAAFVEASSGEDRGNVDLTLGRSGTLLGAALLLETIPDDPLIDRGPLLALGRTVAESSWAALESLPEIGDPAGLAVLGAAHGWAGLLFAQLRFAEAIHCRPPANLERRLSQLLGLAQPLGSGLGLPRALGRSLHDPLVGSWCNGAAGVVPLFILAERVYREPAYLIAAERFGQTAIESSNGLGSLCCGATGPGFAALGLFRATGKKDWRGAAERCVHHACAARFPHSMDHSLYKGPLGAALLELELQGPDDSLLPLYDS
jgi:serine/threonine-protein kinase